MGCSVEQDTSEDEDVEYGAPSLGGSVEIEEDGAEQGLAQGDSEGLAEFGDSQLSFQGEDSTLIIYSTADNEDLGSMSRAECRAACDDYCASTYGSDHECEVYSIESSLFEPDGDGECTVLSCAEIETPEEEDSDDSDEEDAGDDTPETPDEPEE